VKVHDNVAADRRGVSVEVLAREALERAVDYDDWFLREVETGLAQIDAGQTLIHNAVGARLAKKRAADRTPVADAPSLD
jgi:predicted transcriptional regulator